MPNFSPVQQCPRCLGLFDWAVIAEHNGVCGECAAVVICLRESAPGVPGCHPLPGQPRGHHMPVLSGADVSLSR